ncbi:hypothetical protein LTR36_008078 [Oleoguttula mirabilis]|uniref:Uncharacterized protein n=1 Tax=Oleoguttula mirabilis TaxID=1507867 RepID=A0AAV9J927_9PEZI|nr:hypothetical protein LTR36_008078 [Oleoguttula mirabilis]
MTDVKDTTQYVEEFDKANVTHDEAIELPASLAGLSDDEIKKLGVKTTTKLDLVIMPALVILYILNYLDRQNVAASKLANIMKDLDMTVQQYNTAVSILFAGYSAFYYLSMFYNRKQIAFRTAVLYSGSQLGNAFGTLFAIAILKLDGRYGLNGWRWLFLIEGIMTVGFAIIFACILPNSPRKIRGFTQQQQDWLRWNYESDQKQQDHSDEITAKQGLLMAVQDPKTWLMCGTLYATYTAAAVNNFFPTVVAGLGFSRNTSYGLTAPPFVLCVICMLINGFHSDKTQERFLHIALPLVITVIANIIAVSTLNVAARYVATMLMPASFYSSSIVQLAWISGSLSQPAVKRAASIALINCICNTPNIWTSYTYYDSPRYVAAFGVNLGAAVIAMAMATATFFYLRRQNVKMDQGRSLGKSGPTIVQQAAGFRYLL